MDNTSMSPGSPSLQSSSGKPALVSMRVLIILLGILILGGSVAAYLLTYGGGGVSVKQAKQNPTPSPTQRLAANTVVYGYWQDTSAYINSYDLTTNKNTLIAKLPLNVKHVKVINPNKIMYISNANERDYGSELVSRVLTTQQDTVILKADAGYGIDDYVVSSDGNYAAVWQVAPPPNSAQLRGGGSKVTSVAVSDTTKKYTLYDEPTTSPVHYPVAVLNTGEVYTDRFLPNADAGWAYGMSYSDFEGKNKTEVSSMAAGTYGTQPIQSPDGTKIVFAGYDGSNGPGTEVVGGFRRAIVSPNTVEILDLVTQVRTKIASSTNGIYTSALWDAPTASPIYTFISKEEGDSGSFTYDMGRSVATKLVYPGVQSTLSGGALLTAEQSDGDIAVGNLGSKYTPTLKSLFLVREGEEKGQKIEISGSYIQLMGVTKSGYFPATIDAAKSTATQSDRQLKLQTIGFKPDLVPQRTEQQSGERCRDVAAAQCNAMLGTNFSGDEARKKNTGNEEFAACFDRQFGDIGLRRAINCVDSPLYLYGVEGTSVKVMPGTILYSPNVPYSQEGFDITLEKNGRFSANGKSIESLAFDYKPAIKVGRPENGVVVAKSKVAETVKLFSKELGLNERETMDTVLYATEQINSSHAFISVFDDKTSKKILPLYFDPVPTSYRNIVFYLEKMDGPGRENYSMPELEKIKRSGFTAVEISFIVR